MWFLPTRRPHLVERVFSVCPPTEPGRLIVDERDAHLYEGKKVPWPVHVVGNTTCFRDKINAAVRDFPDEDYYGSLGDDMIPESPGWDLELARSSGRTGIAGSSQVYIKGKIGAGVIGGDLVRALGWLCLPVVDHFYGDDAMELIGSTFGCLIMREDIKVAHYHFSVGRAPYDASYKTRGSSALDKQAFELWRGTEWPTVRDRIAHLYY